MAGLLSEITHWNLFGYILEIRIHCRSTFNYKLFSSGVGEHNCTHPKTRAIGRVIVSELLKMYYQRLHNFITILAFLKLSRVIASFNSWSERLRVSCELVSFRIKTHTVYMLRFCTGLELRHTLRLELCQLNTGLYNGRDLRHTNTCIHVEIIYRIRFKIHTGWVRK